MTTNASIDRPSEPPATADFGARLEGFRERLDAELGRWLAAKRAGEAGAAAHALELTAKLEEFVRGGGKRIRPALVYHAYRGCGGDDDARVMPACLAVELLHSYLLIHDDIMDRAETRRGQAAMHVVFAGEHRRRGWRGDADHNGLSVAILLGDLAGTYAAELVAGARPPAGFEERFRGAYAAMCEEVIVGQYLEMTAPYRSDLDEAELLRILRMKSGSYSVEHPIMLGALMAGAAAARLEELSRFGAGLGEAFQLQDDLLGLFGDRDKVGKSVVSDLAEGKHTVLIHHTLERARGAERERVLAALGNAEITVEEAERVKDVIRTSGALAHVVGMIDERVAEAERSLARLGLSAEGTAFFSGLTRYLKERRR